MARRKRIRSDLIKFIPIGTRRKDTPLSSLEHENCRHVVPTWANQTGTEEEWILKKCSRWFSFRQPNIINPARNGVGLIPPVRQGSNTPKSDVFKYFSKILRVWSRLVHPYVSLHLDAASNLSDFFFRFHFQGLKSRPNEENLLLRAGGAGGILELELGGPTLEERGPIPFGFVLAAKRQRNILLNTFFFKSD